MTFYAYHGVNSWERQTGQWFVVDLWVELDLRIAGQTDSLADTVSYSDLFRTVQIVVEGETYNLLETVAEAIAQRVLARFPVEAVWARVKKPAPPITHAVLKGAAVEVFRTREDRLPG